MMRESGDLMAQSAALPANVDLYLHVRVLIGIILGVVAAAIGARILGVPFVFDPRIVAIAFLFSAAVGVIFGYFPARQAGQLDPIEALRRE